MKPAPELREKIEVLVADDDRLARGRAVSLLESEGFSVTEAGKGSEALKFLRRVKPAIVLAELDMSDSGGMRILETAREVNPGSLVLVTSRKPSVLSSIRAFRAGAWSYLPKPFPPLRLNLLVRQAARLTGREPERAPVEREARPPVRKVAPTPAWTRPAAPEEVPATGRMREILEEPVELVGETDPFRRVVQAAHRAAGSDVPVFLSGETGTGKELLARFIHQQGRRAGAPMIAVNCASLSAGPMESELFGWTSGAGPAPAGGNGAHRREGLLEAASGGTLFLDELDRMPESVQARLVRVVQDGMVRRVGSAQVDAVVDIRFIAATDADPEGAVREGRLRSDLLHHLQIFPIDVPALRDRAEDVDLLARHFLHRFWRMYREGEEPVPELGDRAAGALRRWPWHGNVRELRNLMERSAVTLPPGTRAVEPDDLPFRGHPEPADGGRRWLGTYFHEEYHTARKELLSEFERSYLQHVIRQARGNVSDAAREAGVDRATLYRLMAKHEIRKEQLLEQDVD